MATVTNILNKHLGVVHNSSPLSIVQRKAINILLKNAEKTMQEDVEHKISARDLMKGLGWSSGSKTPENLKECLGELVSIKIEWNILEVDKKSKWVASTVLASAAIKDGDVYYTYSHPLRSLLSNPNVYAKLDLDIQKLLKIKYSQLIWEYISGELSSKKTDTVVTQWLTYSQLLKLTYLENSAYEKRYSLFTERVLDKAVSEINLKADVDVLYETKSERGKITHIRFRANKKSAKTLLLDFLSPRYEEDAITEQLQSIGVPVKQIQKIKKNYTEIEIQNAMDFFQNEMRNLDRKINNPIGYLNKALEEGWVLPEVIQSRISTVAPNIKDEEKGLIDHIDEPEDLKNLRKYLFDTLGSAPYCAWFKETRFKLIDTVLHVSTNTQFQADWMENNYRHHILDGIKALKIDMIDRLEFEVQNHRINA